MVAEEKPVAGRKRSGKRIAVGLAVLLLVAGGGAAWYGGLFHEHRAGEDATGEQYTCGMHPWIITDKPGDCPICGMRLTKIVKQPGANKAQPVAASPKKDAEDFFADVAPKGAAQPRGERKLLFYRNPMNGMVTSPTPAKDEMGMDYVPVYEDEAAQGKASAVEGLATVRVADDVLLRSGVQTAPAARATAGRTIRTVGIVVPDETRVRRVQTKVAGWIEKLYVNFTGQYVAAGQPLVSIYSPELLSTQEEYLRAKKTAEQFTSSPDPEVRGIGVDLVRSARRRLELFDIPASFIDSLEKLGTPQKAVTLVAPFAGSVTAKSAFEGQKVEPGMELFTLSDLSKVWVEASLYEYEAAAALVGKQATLTLSHQELALKGSVTFVSPVLAADSRTLTVRFEFPNPGLVLKPQMHVDVSLALDASTSVVVPDAALMDTGLRTIVFVETAPGTFEPRAVVVGVRGDGTAEILSGLREGELVAVKANFLLDSESRLRSAIERMTTGKDGAK
jgi:multidrug efflux pump subunit AcrA (membrane-fusion protein)